MKIGIITKTNEKGQVVIPKRIRDELGIESRQFLNLVVRGGGLYIYPVEDVIGRAETESSYLELLKKTQGSWVGDAWSKTRNERKEIELSASKKRKGSW